MFSETILNTILIIIHCTAYYYSLILCIKLTNVTLMTIIIIAKFAIDDTVHYYCLLRNFI